MSANAQLPLNKQVISAMTAGVFFNVMTDILLSAVVVTKSLWLKKYVGRHAFSRVVNNRSSVPTGLYCIAVTLLVPIHSS